MVALSIKTPLQHADWTDLLAVWRAADEMEVFESAWNFDHFYPLTPPADGGSLEAATTLAALAQATTRLRIGTMVHGMHYRHPAVTANMAATLDIISEGRFDLGLGAGWFEPESQAYGIPLGTMTERMDRFDEGVEVIVRLLSEDTTSFDGTYYQLQDARCEPKGPQRPKPPIVIGGKGKRRTLRTVARWADHWDALTTETTQEWAQLNDVLLAHCSEVARDPAEIRRSVHIFWDPGADVPQLAERAHEYGDAGVDLVIFSMRPPYEAARLQSLANALAPTAA